MTDCLKVALDIRVVPGVSGGVAVAVQSLLQGLAGLVDGDEEYHIVTHGEKQEAWISSIVGPNQRVVPFRRFEHRGVRGLMNRALRPLARRVRREVDRRVWPEVPLSDGFHERLGCQVLHLPTQGFFLCALPTIYNPHDLQHLRYPQFFSPEILSWRETIYPAGCHFAHTIVVGSQWIKDDVVRRYGVDPEKIQVIPEAAPSEAWQTPSDADIARVRRQYQLDRPFVLYPGVTWPHKNHLRLFRALAQLRDERGLIIPLVCTGTPFPEFWPKVETAVREMNLTEQVTFAGFVPEVDLRALYNLATALVFPSLYEASSLPIFEAWFDGLPVACSNAAALPQQVCEAALLFDPLNIQEMADAIAKVTLDATVRAQLKERGRLRLNAFELGRTAKAYRAVYRRAADVPLNDEDRWLLQWDWMRDQAQVATPLQAAGPS